MVDGDAVEPGANRGITAKLLPFPVSFQENVVRHVLRPVRIGKKAERQIVHGPAVGLIKRSEVPGAFRAGRLVRTILIDRRFAHEWFHW